MPPHPVYPSPVNAQPNLTKREIFAAMAMQGLCASPHSWDLLLESIAQCAVGHADALIAELEKKPEVKP
jgi:hypothetical protein